jgi:hypothetical protein
MKYRNGWIALFILAALSPLGIIAAGEAWGEWDLDGIRDLVGFEPHGMAGAAAPAEAPFQDYSVAGLTGSRARESLATVVAAVLGAGITALIAWGITRVARHGGIS